MNRKIIWGIPIGMAVIGLMIVLFSYIQPSQTATVLGVKNQSYTPSKKMVRGTSSSVYREELEVRFGDGQITTVTFSGTNPLALPKEGDEIQVSRWGAGMAIHPNRTLIAVGGTIAMIGGFFLVTFLLTKWSLSRERKKTG